jgi:hypothetical protein
VVDDDPDVVDRAIRHDLCYAGLGIDLCDVTAVRIRGAEFTVRHALVGDPHFESRRVAGVLEEFSAPVRSPLSSARCAREAERRRLRAQVENQIKL